MITVLFGFLFGFVGSMPVAGPIALLVFARGLEGRMPAGLSIAVGAALAESIYAFLAYWGLGVLIEANLYVVPACRGIAAAVLGALGVYFLRRPGLTTASGAPKPRAVKRSFVLGFTVTALNPTLVATWAGAATTLFSTGLVRFQPALALPFALAACAGIVLWFAVLLEIVRRTRGRFRPATLERGVRAMGVLLIVVGAVFAVLFGNFLYATISG